MDMRRDLESCYNFITNFLNHHYREELLEIDEVKRGKFILEYCPESGDPGITFIWWNDFDLEEPDEITDEWEEEFNRVYNNRIKPAVQKVRQKVSKIKEQFYDGFYPDIISFHELHEENYEIEVAQDHATVEEEV